MIEIEVVTIYRYLDKLHDHQQEIIQQISFEHTKKILGIMGQMAFMMLQLYILGTKRKMNYVKKVFPSMVNINILKLFNLI
jgi:hypothetical protein